MIMTKILWMMKISDSSELESFAMCNLPKLHPSSSERKMILKITDVGRWWKWLSSWWRLWLMENIMLVMITQLSNKNACILHLHIHMHDRTEQSNDWMFFWKWCKLINLQGVFKWSSLQCLIFEALIPVHDRWH